MNYSEKYQRIIDQYEELRAKVVQLTKELHTNHQDHTQCKKGCADCCIKFSVFPLELNYIQNHSSIVPMIGKDENDPKCIFLKDNACTIYDQRPLICISHGLPILHLNEQTDDYELSFCPLNFKDVYDDYFDYSNILEFDPFNSELFQLNKKFIELNSKRIYKPDTLIELNKKEFKNFNS